MKCKKGFNITVCKSAAGYYIGTVDEDGVPNCRISGYADNEKDADSLSMSRQFGCVENEYCNGGRGCFVEGAE